MRTMIVRLLRGLAALAALLILVAGVPIALWIGVGWPLPHEVPTWQHVTDELTQGGVPAIVVIDVLAVACWLTWVSVTAAIAEEVGAVVRGRSARPIPLMRPLQPVIAHLVAVVAVAVVSLNVRPSAPAPHGSPPLAVAIARTVAPAQGASGSQRVVHEAPRTWTYTVQRGDSLYRIAERELGDGMRYPELFHLNAGRLQPDGRRLERPDRIRTGWTIEIPVTEGAEGQTSPAPAAAVCTTPPPAQAVAPPVVMAPSVVVTPTSSPTPAAAPSVHPPAPSPTSAPSPYLGPGTMPSFPQRRGGVVDLPSGGVVALSFVAGVGSALGMQRLRERRWRRLGEPGPAEAMSDEGLSRLVRSLRRIHLAADGGMTAGEDTNGAEPAARVLVGDVNRVTPPGVVTVGEQGGRPIEVDLARLGSLAFAGPGAENSLRAVALELLLGASRAIGRIEILVAGADLAATLGLASVAHSALTVAETSDDALRHLEVEAVHRTRIIDRAGADDRAALIAADPGEPMPLTVVVARTDGLDAARLGAILAGGRRLGIVAVLVGAWDQGVTIEVVAGRRIGRVSGDVSVVGELRAVQEGHVVALSAAEGVECLSVLGDPPPRPFVAAETAAVAEVLPAATDADGSALAAAAETKTDAEPTVADGGGLETPLVATDTVGVVTAPRPVRVALLGGFRIDVMGGEIKTGLRSSAREFLAFVLMHPHGVTSEVVIEALWPDMDAERASEQLYTAVANLRRVLRTASGDGDPDFVERAAGQYRPDPTLIDTDVWRFEAAMAAFATAKDAHTRIRALEAATEAYGGDFLDQMGYEWAEPLRENLRGRAVDAMARLADLCESENPDAAVVALEQAVRVDPYSEELYQRLMRLLGRLGRPEAVRRAWRQLQARMAELDADPDEASDKAFREGMSADARELRGQRVAPQAAGR